ncbi:hypothetical protein RUM43_014802 [Polyplax serrata]|uniref:Uncharacterized protein n=1 Tax=Polyplax serrata TaxID=468196 RepID=A0AAN8PGH9_POLSC
MLMRFTKCISKSKSLKAKEPCEPAEFLNLLLTEERRAANCGGSLILGRHPEEAPRLAADKADLPGGGILRVDCLETENPNLSEFCDD